MKTENAARSGPFRPLHELFSLRPVSAAATVLCTLWAAALCVMEDIGYKVPFLKEHAGLGEDILEVLILFAAGVFFLENAFPRLKGVKKGAAVCLSGLLAFLFGALGDAGDFAPAPGFGKALRALFGGRCGAFCAGYALILFVLILWVCCKHSGAKDFSAYALNVFVRVALAGCVTLIVLLGLTLLVFITDELLWDTPSRLGDVLLVLPLGLWFCPKAEHALIEGTGETPRFASVIVRRVLLTLCAAAYAVLYVYLFKILITWTFPKNTVFAILTALFFISLPVAVMSRDEEKQDISHKLAALFPGLFVPFTAMQTLCLYMRVNEYGLTTSRYLGAALIVFEIVFCLWMLFKPGTVRGALLILAVLIAVCVFAPEINCVTLPDALQAKTLLKGLAADTEKLSGTELSRLRAAVSYRGSGEEHENWLNTYFTEEEQARAAALQERLRTGSTGGSTVNLYFSVKWPVEVSGYRQLYSVKSDYYDSDSTPPPLTAVPLYGSTADTQALSVTVDLTETADSLLSAYRKDPDFDSKASPEVLLPDGSRLILRQFSYARSGDEMILRQVTGWLLVK